MNDLNDLYYFHAVATHQGFSAASRHIGVPKATLSKGVARLEERLQVRLLERTTGACAPPRSVARFLSTARRCSREWRPPRQSRRRPRRSRTASFA
ncbi:LysR family transcriptional regulator [Pseudoroseomonas wenyumeiae]